MRTFEPAGGTEAGFQLPAVFQLELMAPVQVKLETTGVILTSPFPDLTPEMFIWAVPPL